MKTHIYTSLIAQPLDIIMFLMDNVHGFSILAAGRCKFKFLPISAASRLPMLYLRQDEANIWRMQDFVDTCISVNHTRLPLYLRCLVPERTITHLMH